MPLLAGRNERSHKLVPSYFRRAGEIPPAIANDKLAQEVRRMSVGGKRRGGDVKEALERSIFVRGISCY